MHFQSELRHWHLAVVEFVFHSLEVAEQLQLNLRR